MQIVEEVADGMDEQVSDEDVETRKCVFLMMYTLLY